MTKIKIERTKNAVSVAKPEAGQYRTNDEGEVVLIVEHGAGLNVVLLNFETFGEEHDAFLQYSEPSGDTDEDIQNEYPTVISAKVVIE